MPRRSRSAMGPLLWCAALVGTLLSASFFYIPPSAAAHLQDGVSRAAHLGRRDGDSPSTADQLTQLYRAGNVLLPPVPRGSKLVQFKGCGDLSTASLPLFVTPASFVTSGRAAQQYLVDSLARVAGDDSTRGGKDTDGGPQVSKAKRAWIYQHGAANDGNRYFAALLSALTEEKPVDAEVLIISPQFYKASQAPSFNASGLGAQSTPASGNTPQQQDNWYQPQLNLAWADGYTTWCAGEDAVAPAAVGHGKRGRRAAATRLCSSYDVYDRLLSMLHDRKLYPHLEEINFVGHSMGATAVASYSLVSKTAHRFSGRSPNKQPLLRFVVGNPFLLPWFTPLRPNTDVGRPEGYNSWPYGLQPPYPEYVGRNLPADLAKSLGTNATGDSTPSDANSGSSSSLAKLWAKWISLPLDWIVGTRDTYAAYPGFNSLQLQTQGGENRRERNYAFWASAALLSDLGPDEVPHLTEYYGYEELKRQGLAPLVHASLDGRASSASPNASASSSGAGAAHLPKADFRWAMCVQDVGHNQTQVLQTECGRAAVLLGKPMPQGLPPQRP